MSIEFSELFKARNIQEAKIASLQDLANNVTDRNWMSEKILAGTSRAINLRLDDQLKAEDPIQWGENVLRAGRMKFRLALVEEKYAKKLSEIKSELTQAQKRTPFGFVTNERIDSEDFTHTLESKQMLGFLSEIPEDFGRLIKQFIMDPEGRRILTIVKNFSANDIEQSTVFNRRVAGSVFEQISYLHLKPLLEQPKTQLFSPGEILLLYQNLYLKDTPSSVIHHGLSEGIMGITIPDGLLIKETEECLIINNIMEYKSWIRQDKSGRNHLQSETDQKTLERHLRLNDKEAIDPKYLGQLIHMLRPDLASKPVTVNPAIRTIYGFPSNSKILVPDADIRTIPIDSRDFGEFITALSYLIAIAK